MQNLTREDPLNEVQQKWVNGEIPVVATIAFGMGIDKANAKKGLSDDAKDIQIKALQTGHKLMASFFNESDLKKCLKNCDFCRIPEQVSQQANALKTQRQESLQKKEEEEYSGFENGLERTEKEEVSRLKLLFR
ncbi:hypothetical protein WR25_15906 [Diploscapter pachys]|uniref:Uncharacterized protein n=1 Tax=Diploscapter pachys TaxID=2018661 RepID=A0A2A2J399_9BILA|nr:hypothetical protein WR25_15906 [Diploscapter pachys]